MAVLHAAVAAAAAVAVAAPAEAVGAAPYIRAVDKYSGGLQNSRKDFGVSFTSSEVQSGHLEQKAAIHAETTSATSATATSAETSTSAEAATAQTTAAPCSYRSVFLYWASPRDSH